MALLGHYLVALADYILQVLHMQGTHSSVREDMAPVAVHLQ